jgi:hypothetical protein
VINNIRRSMSRTCMLALLTGIAVAQAPINFEGSNSSEIVNVVQSGSGFGIEASTTSTGGVGAVFGQATGTSGYNNGFGDAASVRRA